VAAQPAARLPVAATNSGVLRPGSLQHDNIGRIHRLDANQSVRHRPLPDRESRAS